MKQKTKRLLSMLLVLALTLSMLPAEALKAAERKQNTVSGDYKIAVGEEVTEMQEYAAKELRKYLFQLSGEDVEIVTAEPGMDLTNTFVLGTAGDNSLLEAVQTEIDSIADTGAEGHEGEQGYVLKKSGNTLYIAGTDDAGTLYGVYGLLDDYYGIGFYFSGDVIPQQKRALYMPEVNEAKTPRQYMRGVLPWTNFPQSATVYSTEDWMYIIDQMARMRMNFLNIHNYNAECGHNEMFHNFTYDGHLSRNWNATAKTGHNWGCPGWDVNQYRFGATDLFDDYDFGTDATLHNESLNNEEVYAKGWSQFQFLIDYGHTRGVKMGLGLDINIILPEYGVAANAPGLPEARAEEILTHYENMDTLILYVSEMINNNPAELERWKDCFTRMYNTIRAERPDMQIAISGWGISPAIAAFVPDDVVIAPISNYKSGFVTGTTDYPGKEYWGGPWVERDFQSSVYFYPYKTDLDVAYGHSSNTPEPGTIQCYEANKDTMSGLFTLSWRLTDGVDAKMMYIAKAPWDLEGKFAPSGDGFAAAGEAAQKVYREYAEKCYGAGLTEEMKADLAKLLYADEKTVVASDWSECNGTYGFGGGDRSADVAKLQSFIDRVDTAIQASDDQGAVARLKKLRDRLVCAQYYCKLDDSFNANETSWENLDKDFSVWAKSFQTRVDDISSLGNNQSAQNRYVQQRYVALESQLRNGQAIKAPVNVVVKNTADGAVLTWNYENKAANGFKVFRDGKEIATLEDVRTYADTYDGTAVYTVTALTDGGESTASIPQTCDAGSADKNAPQAIVVSPSTTVRAGQDMKVKARILDNSAYESLSATIHYRALGSDAEFTEMKMERRAKAVFAADVPSAAFADTGIEYYVTASDSRNIGYWPASAPDLNAVCTVYTDNSDTVIHAPKNVEAVNGGIEWNDAGENVHWYRIYRGDTPDFTPSMANFVTYVEKGTTSFADVPYDFDGSALAGKEKYYRVTAVDQYMNESIPSKAAAVKPAAADPLTSTLFVNGDEFSGCQQAAQAGSTAGQVVGFTVPGGYTKFAQMKFSETMSYNAVDVSYATDLAGGKMEVRLDSPDGKKLGEAVLDRTGGWGTFRTVTIPLEPGLSGTHDLYFVYQSVPGAGPYLYNLDWFRVTNKHVVSDEKWVLTTNDLMAFKANNNSPMREDAPSITNFGSEGDKIVLGKGTRVNADNVSYSGNSTWGASSVITLPGYQIPCIANFQYAGSQVTFKDLTAGRAYLAYDRADSYADQPLAVYKNGVKENNMTMTHTGSDWGGGNFKVMYLDTGVNLTEGDTLKLQCDTECAINIEKLFVTQNYSAEQMNISYSNNADTQYSLYINGTDMATVTLPDSNGTKKTYSVVQSMTDALIELRVDADDLAANANEKATVYEITLCEEVENSQPEKVTVTASAGEGGMISPSGQVEVIYGEDQKFTFVPNAGYGIDKVFVNGTDYGQRSSYTFESLTYDAAIEVTFAKNADGSSWSIAVEETVKDWISTDAVNAQAGEPVTVTVASDADHSLVKGSLRFVTASHPEGMAISEKQMQFTMPDENVVVTAQFEEINRFEGVDAAIAKAETLVEKQYTESTWKALQEAIAKADHNRTETDPEKIAKLEKDILDAIDALELRAYEPEKEVYKVTVINKTNTVTEEHVYNDAVEVEAEAADAGFMFAGWEVNGHLVTAEKTYKFYVANDMSVKAVYAENEVAERNPEAVVTNVITEKSDTKYNVKFVGQLVVPKDYTVLKAGLVWSSKEEPTLDAAADGVKVTYISKISNTNQFSVTIKGMPEGRFLRGKVFAQVQNVKTGETQWIYSEEKRAVTEK